MEKRYFGLVIILVALFSIQFIYFQFYSHHFDYRYELVESKFDKIPIIIKFDKQSGKIKYQSITKINSDQWEIIDDPPTEILTQNILNSFKFTIKNTYFKKGSGYSYGHKPIVQISVISKNEIELKNIFTRIILFNKDNEIESILIKKLNEIVPGYFHIIDFEGKNLPWIRELQFDIYISSSQEGPWIKLNSKPFDLENTNEKEIEVDLNEVFKKKK